MRGGEAVCGMHKDVCRVEAAGLAELPIVRRGRGYVRREGDEERGVLRGDEVA